MNGNINGLSYPVHVGGENIRPNPAAGKTIRGSE
jgi:hypothetical protein